MSGGFRTWVGGCVGQVRTSKGTRFSLDGDNGKPVIPKPQPRDLPVCSAPHRVAVGEILRFAQHDPSNMDMPDVIGIGVSKPRADGDDDGTTVDRIARMRVQIVRVRHDIGWRG